MQWVTIVLMILRLLKDLKSSSTEHEFAATASAVEIGDGQIIEWIWENREEILEFILKIIGMFGNGQVGISASGQQVPRLSEVVVGLID